MLKINNNVTSIVNGQQIVLLNFSNGRWIRTNKAYYNFIEDKIKNNKDIYEIARRIDQKKAKVVAKILDGLLEIDYLIDDEQQRYQDCIENVTFVLTHKCNLKCSHCILNAAPTAPDMLDLEAAKQIVLKIVEISPKNLTFSGGEPFIRKDFIELLAFTRENFTGEIHVISNGTVIPNESMKRLPQLVDVISLSMDGYDKASCEKIRGKGVYEKLIQKIKELQDNGFTKITLSQIITKDNSKNEEKFFELCEELSVVPMLRPLISDGRAKGDFSTENLVPTDMMFQELNGYRCRPGKREIMISYNGDLFPCVNLVGENYKIGNVLENQKLLNELSRGILKWDTIDDFIESERPYNNQRCKDCKVNLFCWECVARFQAINKNEEKFQEFCDYKRKKLYQEIWGELFEHDNLVNGRL